jgi:hypothetical protein
LSQHTRHFITLLLPHVTRTKRQVPSVPSREDAPSTRHNLMSTVTVATFVHLLFFGVTIQTPAGGAIIVRAEISKATTVTGSPEAIRKFLDYYLAALENCA